MRAVAVGCSALASIRDDGVAGIFKHIGCNEALGSLDECVDLDICESCHETERIDALNETNLRFENVADARQHMLVEQNVANLFTGTCTNAECCGGSIEVLIENV